MGWLSTLISAGSALATTGLNIAARKNEDAQQQYLAQKKLNVQGTVTNLLADPTNQGLPAKDLVNKAMQGIDQSDLSDFSKTELQNYVTDETTAVQTKINARMLAVQQSNNVNNSVDLMNQLRNHVTAGDLTVEGAENLYEGSVKGALQKNLDPDAFHKINDQFKSSIRLDTLKQMNPDQIHQALQSTDYKNNMTSSDYQAATVFAQNKHSSNVQHLLKVQNLQLGLAKDVLNGNFTPNELNVLKLQHQDVNSDALISTVHTFDLIKKMTVPELQDILKPPTGQLDRNGNPLPVDQLKQTVQQDDNFKSLIKERINAVRTNASKDLVGFAEANSEIRPLVPLGADPVAIKASIKSRLTDIAGLQAKYQTKAASIFTQDETRQLKAQFDAAGNKGQILNAFSKALPVGQYGQADNIFYAGAGADMQSINSGSINFANDSYKGYMIKQTKAFTPLPAKTNTLIRSEISRFVPVTNNKMINSLTNQISNVVVGRGLKVDSLSSSDVDSLIQESTGSVMYPQKSVLGMFAKDAYILAPDKDKAKILSSVGKTSGKWAQDHESDLFSKITGGISIQNLYTSNKQRIDLKHLARHTVLKNITPTTYQMVYTDYTGQTSSVYDKDGKPIIIDANKIDSSDVENYNGDYGTVGGIGIDSLKDTGGN